MRSSRQKPPRRPRAKAADGDGKQTVWQEAINIALFVAGVFLVAGALGVAVAAMPPEISVGDQVTLSTATPVFAESLVLRAKNVATVFAAGSSACTLDTGYMAREGGTLTVMAVRADGVVLSWAGAATAPDAANCGADSKLLLAENDYAALLKSRTPKH